MNREGPGPSGFAQQITDRQNAHVQPRLDDYLFARVAVARMQLRAGQVDEAEATLQPAFSQRRLHTSEFETVMDARLSLLEARRQIDGIESWLNLWEDVNPESKGLENWRSRLALLQLPAQFERLMQRSRKPRTPRTKAK